MAPKSLWKRDLGTLKTCCHNLFFFFLKKKEKILDDSLASISSFTFLINKSSEGKIETEDLSFKNEEIEVLMSQGVFLLQTLSSFLLLKAFVSKRKIYLGHKNPEELCKMHSADYL